MNERIRELAEQAQIKYSIRDDAFYVRSFDGVTRTCMEKFAELIVRECVTKMALEIMDNSWIDDAVKNTYKHFGVE